MTADTTNPDPSFYAHPENSLGYLCRIAFRNFSRALEKRTLPLGVTAGQWRFLRVLWAEDGLSQRELSRRVGMREPTTVVALKSLEKSGYIRREPNASDRRITNVFLTQAARDIRQDPAGRSKLDHTRAEADLFTRGAATIVGTVADVVIVARVKRLIALLVETAQIAMPAGYRKHFARVDHGRSG